MFSKWQILFRVIDVDNFYFRVTNRDTDTPVFFCQVGVFGQGGRARANDNRLREPYEFATGM